MRSIDIVCPVYAEGDAIRIFHERLLSALAALTSRYVFRFIYVVDPAGDGTEAVLEDLVSADSRVEALVMSRRFGHQMALVAGLDASSGDAVVMLDSDLQHPPEIIVQFVEQWEQGGDIVQAIRTDGRDVASWKRLTSKWFYKTFMSVGSIELKSGAADFRLLSRRVVDVFRSEMREHSPFLRGLVSWVGFNVRYVPFDTARRVAGRTKYRLSTLVEFAINGVTSFSRVPLRACVMIGMLIALVSIIYGIYSVVDALLFTRLVPGWATLITMVSLLGGIQLVFLGVLGEYIAVIFEEVKDRPRYLVARHLLRDDSSSPEVAPVESTAILAKSKAHIDRR
jgi:glycosyltransferase involved in cell wall biosynthesis